MPLFNPHDLRNLLQSDQRVLGLDPGSKTIGVALTDVTLILASPLIGLKRRKLSENAQELAKIVRTQDVGALVVGLPLSLDGSFGPAARAASDWTQALSEKLGIPAGLWDERLSSSAVNRFLIKDADMTRGRRAEVVDKMAAAYMLQGWLDSSRPESPEIF
ncbi:Holliday junction resolvase RuvX [Gluconobacter sphaericus]|uniref:Putative pre-16S rRNA nuclease n=1 Tax=Gluconobacter sphaericus NBRC 12467 TaxID=1307951 RepID=A0AA37SF49_9PROT|nr:Holliday junction resolvase RuvX [Gluconobacter sphaericus]MBF0885408.1 Holliday junction resolvase RuvX [Gluconobacter sphaericus]MBS1084892.1 Holliday junction resolvase RuvX [Gluconobacter sphaericus]MBS1098890.1 Holliday junction resolvase RuvX [Gluconobacter sphaericus]QQX91045.1 Holliday junction resolvase RuvX [Gluconobacter sphaericus]GBR56242.1 Holliday junction resolvase YqgF [Gluconobacter sphaericus NBRC 12467]